MADFAVQSRATKFQLLAFTALFSGSVLAAEGHSHAHTQKQETTRAHTHGAGELEIVQDGNGLFISFYTPLYNVLGFEHKPKTDTERVKARRVTSLLQANGLFSFSSDAQCKRSGYKLYSDILNPHSHGPEHDHQHHNEDSAHPDLRAVYEFECQKPEALKQIEVNVFRQFYGFEKIDVQALFPSGQMGASLSLKKNILVIR